MGAVFDFFTKTNSLVPEYPRWLFWVIIVLVLVLSQLAKLPIKHFTSKIKNENLRKKVNTVIMLLPIAFGFLASWILTFFGFSFSVTAALVWGTTSQVIYEFISRVIRRINNNEEITNDTLEDDLKESIASVGKPESAEDKFNDLVDKIKKGD